MKKIICLLLVCVSLLCCVSCKGDKDRDNTPTYTIDGIKSVISNSAPTKIVTRSEYVGNETLSAMYTTQIDRVSGNVQFDYSYEDFAAVEDLLSNGIKTVEGTIYYHADGSVTASEGSSWSSEDARGYLPEEINIDVNGFKSYELLNEGKNLSAIVKPEEFSRIFGVGNDTIDVNTDVVLTVETNGTYLYTITVSYATVEGAQMVISTSYDYSPITLDFKD